MNTKDRSRLTVKCFLIDGTKLSKVIWFNQKKVDQKAIMKEFENFIENLSLRIPQS